MKKLVKLALIWGGIVMVAKLVSARKTAWAGLTESEVREKLNARLPARVPDDKRAAIADLVVSKMRERGVIREESESSTPFGGDTETDF